MGFAAEYDFCVRNPKAIFDCKVYPQASKSIVAGVPPSSGPGVTIIRGCNNHKRVGGMGEALATKLVFEFRSKHPSTNGLPWSKFSSGRDHGFPAALAAELPAETLKAKTSKCIVRASCVAQ